MRKHLGDVVNSERLKYLFNDTLDEDFNKKHLHKCVRLTNKYPNLNNYLEEYLKIYNNVNEINDCK